MQKNEGRRMAQLQDLFQTHAVVKILDHLTLYPEFEYTRTDIAKETGISRRTLYQVWPILEKFDLVKVTKSSGMIKFFKLNTENPISKHLIELADKISFFEADKIAGLDSTTEAMLIPFASALDQDQKSVKMTRKIILIEDRIEGTPSQVKELLHEMKNPMNGKITTSVADSTGAEPEPVAAKIGKRQFVFRLHKTNGKLITGE